MFFKEIAKIILKKILHFANVLFVQFRPKFLVFFRYDLSDDAQLQGLEGMLGTDFCGCFQCGH
mgnify:CR=1 FL=1